MKYVLLINLKLLITANSFLLNIAEHIIDIFIFISRENFMLRLVEDEKSFLTSGPELLTKLGT